MATALSHHHGGNCCNQQKLNDSGLCERNVATNDRPRSTTSFMASPCESRGDNGSNIEGHGYSSYGGWAMTTNRKQNVSVPFTTPRVRGATMSQVAEPDLVEKVDEVPTRTTRGLCWCGTTPST